MTPDDILAWLEALPENEKQEVEAGALQANRDIVDRQMAAQQTDVEAARTPGRFDEALANFKARRPLVADKPESGADVDEGLSALVANGEGAKSDKSIPVRVAQDDSPASPTPEKPIPSPFISEDTARAVEVDTPFRLDGRERVEETQSKVAKVRKGAIQQDLKNQLNYAAGKTGLQVEVYSGGQPAVGTMGVDREGGHRHDHGGAADLKLFEIIDGKKRYLNSDNPQDRLKMQAFIQHAVTAGATGVGHAREYMGLEGIHIGGGNILVWGANGDPAKAIPWVKDAHTKGLADRQKLLKAGAWPSPTKPVQFMTRESVPPDFQDITTGDGKALSMMRNLIDTDMILRKIKK